MKLKTSTEKAAMRKAKAANERNKIAVKFNDLISKGIRKSDATIMCANEFNCSLPYVYKARKEYDKSSSEC